MIMGMNVFVRVRVLKRTAIIRIKICNKKLVILKTKMDFIPSVEKVEKLKKNNEFLKLSVEKVEKVKTYRILVEKVETYLNWVGHFFVGSRKSKHAKVWSIRSKHTNFWS